MDCMHPAKSMAQEPANHRPPFSGIQPPLLRRLWSAAWTSSATFTTSTLQKLEGRPSRERRSSYFPSN
eukprot:1805550-Rhodomonas_salina.1